MVSGAGLSGATSLLVGAVVLGLLYVARKYSDSAGALGFRTILLGAAMYCFVSGAITLSASETVFSLLWGFGLFSGNLMAIGWVLLVVDYTRRGAISLRWYHYAGLFAVPVVGQLLYATNGWHHLVVEPPLQLDGTGILALDHGPWFTAHLTYNYLVLALPASLRLFADFLSAKRLHRIQTGILLVGSVLALSSTAGFFVDLPLPPHVDPAPYGFLVAMTVWSAGLFWYQLFNAVPIARKTALDTVPDPVVVLDNNNRITDMNRAALDLFRREEPPKGSPAEEVFAEHPSFGDRFPDVLNEDIQFSLVSRGTERHFECLSRPVTFRGRTTGKLVVLRDVTALKNRERELDNLKDVYSRILRHNLRNEMQVAQGYVGKLAEELDGAQAEYASGVVRSIDTLQETSEKARRIEAVIDSETEPVSQDVVAVAEDVVAEGARTYEHASIDVAAPSHAWVRALPNFDRALWNLVENGVVHNDTEAPSVRIEIERGEHRVECTVSDDGPGVPEHEIAVLEEGTETSLAHGSGAGLWLVHWIVRKSGGDLSFSSGSDGTAVTISLPRAETPHTDASNQLVGHS